MSPYDMAEHLGIRSYHAISRADHFFDNLTLIWVTLAGLLS